jgi:Zn finger protein HypA/HybF involved in hydrogenase expression
MVTPPKPRSETASKYYKDAVSVIKKLKMQLFESSLECEDCNHSAESHSWMHDHTCDECDCPGLLSQ